MDFKNANELLDLCKKHDLPISEVMRQREIVEGEKEADTVHDAMARVLEIMKNAAFTPIKEPVRSMGGLIGGEAKKIASRYHSGIGICGDLLEKSMIYAMATLETNASKTLFWITAKQFDSGRSSHRRSNTDFRLTSADSTCNRCISHSKISDRTGIKQCLNDLFII